MKAGRRFLSFGVSGHIELIVELESPTGEIDSQLCVPTILSSSPHVLALGVNEKREKTPICKAKQKTPTPQSSNAHQSAKSSSTPFVSEPMYNMEAPRLGGKIPSTSPTEFSTPCPKSHWIATWLGSQLQVLCCNNISGSPSCYIPRDIPRDRSSNIICMYASSRTCYEPPLSGGAVEMMSSWSRSCPHPPRGLSSARLPGLVPDKRHSSDSHHGLHSH